MFSNYIEDWEVNSEFEKEFISLWSGWLGKESQYKLDEVEESDWAKFNSLVRLLSTKFKIELIGCEHESILEVSDIEHILSSYKDSMDKDSSQFTKYLIRELDCILSEEWDYTYILWHKNNGAIEALKPFIHKSGLHHFHE